MSETFDCKRFAAYFRYDLRQMGRTHARSALFIGGAGLFFYVVCILFGLLSRHTWAAPGSGARMAVFVVALGVLELCQALTYGHLTDRKAGSQWLLVPASRGEKFLSMLLVTLLVIPLLFLAVYLLLDFLPSVLDPTYGSSLAASFGSYFSDMRVKFFSGEAVDLPFPLSITYLIAVGFLSNCCNYLYFLLCGICFKRNKIIGALAILFGLSVLLSILSALFVPGLSLRVMDLDVDRQRALLAYIFRSLPVLLLVIASGLGWGVWHRLKTIQH